MIEHNETTLFEERGVKITEFRVVIGAQTYSSKTYAISNITSVRMAKKGIGPVTWLLLLVSGGWLCLAFLAVGSIGRPLNEVSDQFWSAAGLPLFILLVAVFLAFVTPKFAVYIGNASGESKLLESSDKAYLRRIVEAINNGIASEGSH